jgi:CMP-2-keto-3-deoxyoctulosonic acid synthetase
MGVKAVKAISNFKTKAVEDRATEAFYFKATKIPHKSYRCQIKYNMNFGSCLFYGYQSTKFRVRGTVDLSILQVPNEIDSLLSSCLFLSVPKYQIESNMSFYFCLF